MGTWLLLESRRVKLKGNAFNCDTDHITSCELTDQRIYENQNYIIYILYIPPALPLQDYLYFVYYLKTELQDNRKLLLKPLRNLVIQKRVSNWANKVQIDNFLNLLSMLSSMKKMFKTLPRPPWWSPTYSLILISWLFLEAWSLFIHYMMAQYYLERY